MIHIYDAWLKKMALHNSHILASFLSICLFRDFKWTITYGLYRHILVFQKLPLLSRQSVARRTKLRRRRSYVRGSMFLLAFYNHHCDRIIVALILIVLLHSLSSQYRHVRSLCLIICITVTSTPSVNL